MIQLDDVMQDEDMDFGPNGGLVFCMEYLLEPDGLDWLKVSCIWYPGDQSAGSPVVCIISHLLHSIFMFVPFKILFSSPQISFSS